jgi:alpha-galactosidase
MSDALKATGRPIVFSICEWGTSKPWTWAPAFAQLWRTTGDIDASYNGSSKWTKGWKGRLDENVGLEKYSRPGHWNDPDMLEVGNGSLTLAESRSHFTFWCMLAAPLIAGNDVRNMSPQIRDILTNRQVISIDQNRHSPQGFRVLATPEKEIWARQLSPSNWAICLFNPAKTSAALTIKWSDLRFLHGHQFLVHDVWQAKEAGTTAEDFSANIGAHDIALLRLSPL